jgi:hypothetical protein
VYGLGAGNDSWASSTPPQLEKPGPNEALIKLVMVVGAERKEWKEPQIASLLGSGQ